MISPYDLQHKLLDFTTPNYPDIDIQIVDEGNERHIYFITEKFATLYPQQRYHYLVHTIPSGFFEGHLTNTIWHELAPGEEADDLDYHDEEVVDSIKETILNILEERTDFVDQLDNLFTLNRVKCEGDFKQSKQILTDLKFDTDEQFDIFHVMMAEGGFCDCEILYNVFNQSNYAKKYWADRNYK